MINNLLLKTIVMAVLLALATACSKGQPTKFSREKCIVEVSLNWQVIDKDRHNIQNRFADNLGEIGYRIDNNIHLAGFMFQRKQKLLYLQYKFDCDDRLIQTETLLSEAIGLELSDMGFYKVSPRIVTPSVDTIMLEGDAWVD